jgi:hypothetical protein
MDADRVGKVLLGKAGLDAQGESDLRAGQCPMGCPLPSEFGEILHDNTVAHHRHYFEDVHRKR